MPAVYIYRWRVKPGGEERFREGWRRITLEALEKHGGLGSRLHRGDGQEWLAYAVWPDTAARDRYAAVGAEDKEAGEMMRSAVEHRYETMIYEIDEDHLAPLAIGDDRSGEAE